MGSNRFALGGRRIVALDALCVAASIFHSSPFKFLSSTMSGDHITGVQKQQSVQGATDVAITAQLREEERYAADDAVCVPGQASQIAGAGVRTDNEMKELLRTLSTPHFVHASMTHGQHNCLIDSMLLALEAQSKVKTLSVEDRAAVCSAVRSHLIERISQLSVARGPL